MPSYPIIHGHRRRRWRPAPAQAWTAPDIVEAVRALYPDPRTTIVVDEDLPAGKFYVVPDLATAVPKRKPEGATTLVC